VRSRDGSTYTVLSHAVPVETSAGRRKSWVGVHLDVTERERSQEQRRRQAIDIERYNAELEQFSYVAAHDLQEPLRMVASYVQLLEKRYKGKLDADADTFIHYAVEGANRLRALLASLQLYSQVGKLPERRAPHDLTELAVAARTRLAEQITTLGAVIHIDPLPTLVCDSNEITQVFESLFDNALKFSQDGVAPQVAVSAEQEGRWWVIRVHDNGIGIEHEFGQRIFDLFQRLHRREKYVGIGVGLALCKKIIQAHGGTIWVVSSPGEGSSFYCKLPGT
jgi:light-regulated signal transduction histidine kinase (bacteriophytochrome)